MKKVSVLAFILLLVCNYSCERDDLCPAATQTTARLFIEAFDVSIPDDSKNIFGLRIEGINENGESNGVLENYQGVSSSELILPLRTDADMTQYRLYQDSTINDNGTPDDTTDDFIEGNADVITITYIREDVFVSRACGFKTVFNNVQIEVDTDDTDQWIQSIRAVNDNQIVENEAEAHFILLH
ncbi:DUF6452 family protein [Hyunsoonleella ulvae]|uniref:DUF6452 family protein n=1 Tax=Hyunsoonleella ulvae TaxID=2799948 RepID=UPI0019394933|nr:DUF6452 family protein [Hyunsoonleella ulvae]